MLTPLTYERQGKGRKSRETGGGWGGGRRFGRGQGESTGRTRTRNKTVLIPSPFNVLLPQLSWGFHRGARAEGRSDLERNWCK